MNPKLRMLRMAAVVAAPPMLLMACTSSHVPAMNGTNMAGDDFNNHLARDYRTLANYEAEEMFDFKDADLYAEKAMASAAGRSVSPDDMSARHIKGDDKVAELRGAYGVLTQAVAAGAAQKSPVTTARAQTQFDCWVEQQEEGHQHDHIAACKNGFWSAMRATQLSMAPAPSPQPPVAQQRPAPAPASAQPSSYRVFFDWDESEVTADARRLIDQAIERSRGSRQGVHLIGYTDASGTNAYNMRLAERRAEAVKDYLIANGVAQIAITSEARGEGDQLVMTRDGVREARNRSVLIELSTRTSGAGV